MSEYGGPSIRPWSEITDEEILEYLRIWAQVPPAVRQEVLEDTFRLLDDWFLFGSEAWELPELPSVD